MICKCGKEIKGIIECYEVLYCYNCGRAVQLYPDHPGDVLWYEPSRPTITDEEIEEYAINQTGDNVEKRAFIFGAKWMMEKMK